MIGQKLIKLLQSLEASEFRKLKKALVSPYFATNQRLQVLYDHLKKLYPDFDEQKMQKEKLFYKLYPESIYNESMLRVLVREFATVVEDFLIMERIREQKYDRKKLLVKEYGKRNLYDFFKKGTQELLKELDDGRIKDMKYFRECVSIYEEVYYHPMTNNYDVNDHTLELLVDNLDSYFVIAKYRYAQILRNSNKILKRKTESRFFNEMRNIKDNLFIHNQLISIYELVNKIHDFDSEEVFYKLKKEFFPIISKIDDIDSRAIYFIGLNFCSRQNTKGKKEFGKESLEWYKLGLENKLLFNNEKISDVSFTNIVMASCRESDFKWANEFINTYQKYLDKGSKIDTLAFCYLVLNFWQGNDEKVIEIFNSNTFSNKYQLNARSLSVYSIFKLGLVDSTYFLMLQPQIEAFGKYIQRNTLLDEDRILPFKNSLTIVNKAYKKIWANDDRRKVKQWMRKQIEVKKPLASKYFLKEITNLI